MSKKNYGREPQERKRKEKWPKAKKKRGKKKYIRPKAYQKRRVKSAWVCQRHKSEKKKMREAQSAWKNYVAESSMLFGLGIIVLYAYVVATYSY